MLMILSRLRYVIRLMEWIDDLITDEKIFPPVDDVPFPRCLTNVTIYVHISWNIQSWYMMFDCVFKSIDKIIYGFLFSNFKDVCKKIFRRLYRVFVHVYIEHFERCFHSRNIFLSQYFHVSPCDVIHLFDRLQEAGAEAHTNTFYRQFTRKYGWSELFLKFCPQALLLLHEGA